MSESNVTGKIMVLVDSISVREEAFRYALELAGRMNCSLIVLVLLGLDSAELKYGTEFNERARDAFLSLLESAMDPGIEMEVEVKMGNPFSELMKYLAVSRSVQTIVWGGSPEFIHQRGHKAPWLVKMKDRLKCPFVVPSTKGESGASG